MKRRFIAMSNGSIAVELDFDGSPTDQDWAKALPRTLPEGTMLVHQWLPGRIGPDGKPMEVERCRLMVVPVDPEGEILSSVTRVMDDADIPEKIKPVAPIPIPKELEAIEDMNVLMDVCAQCNIRVGAGTSAKVIRSLIAREIQINKRAQMWLDNLKQQVLAAAQGKNVGGPVKQAQNRPPAKTPQQKPQAQPATTAT